MSRKIIIYFMVTTILAWAVTASATGTGIDIDKSITIGSGAKTVFEFTDPDCPFCRKASKYFDSRNDITRHVFFLHSPCNPEQRKKPASFSLCLTKRGLTTM